MSKKKSYPRIVDGPTPFSRRKMRTFRVLAHALIPVEAEIEVRAGSEDEALEEAVGAEYDWQEVDHVQYFEIQEVEEVRKGIPSML